MRYTERPVFECQFTEDKDQARDSLVLNSRHLRFRSRIVLERRGLELHSGHGWGSRGRSICVVTYRKGELTVLVDFFGLHAER